MCIEYVICMLEEVDESQYFFKLVFSRYLRFTKQKKKLAELVFINFVLLDNMELILNFILTQIFFFSLTRDFVRIKLRSYVYLLN